MIKPVKGKQALARHASRLFSPSGEYRNSFNLTPYISSRSVVGSENLLKYQQTPVIVLPLLTGKLQLIDHNVLSLKHKL